MAAEVPRTAPRSLVTYRSHPINLQPNAALAAKRIKFSNFSITLNTNRSLPDRVASRDDPLFVKFDRVVQRTFSEEMVGSFMCAKVRNPTTGKMIDAPWRSLHPLLKHMYVDFVPEVGGNRKRLHAHVAFTVIHTEELGFSNNFKDLKAVINQIAAEEDFWPIPWIKVSTVEGITAEQYALKTTWIEEHGELDA